MITVAHYRTAPDSPRQGQGGFICLLCRCWSVRESLIRGKPRPRTQLTSTAASYLPTPLKLSLGFQQLTMPEVEDETTSLLDLIASMFPDSLEDITYLTDMEGEGLCLHQIQAEEQRTRPEEEK